jgi:hypothetical protein
VTCASLYYCAAVAASLLFYLSPNCRILVAAS